MSIVVFYLKAAHDGGMHTPPQPGFYMYEDQEFTLAMKQMESLREQGMHHVTMSTQLANQVGKAGVAAVEDGTLPDGNPYEWSKRHRGEGPANEHR